MSKIALTPNASGTGVFTIASPATSTNRTLTLPDQSGTVLTGSGPINVNASAPNQAVTVDASGNVGIGGTPTVLGGQNYVTVHSPGSSTNIAGYDLYVSGTREASLISYPSNNEALRIAGLTNRAVTFHANNAERMRIDSSGNVGIGTTSPARPLHVLATTQPRFQHTSAPNGIDIGQFDATGNASINNVANAYLDFATNNTTRMRIDSSGNVLVNNAPATGKVNSSNIGGVAYSAVVNASGAGMQISSGGQSNTMNAITFQTNYGAIGSIVCGSATSYNTSSDYRLKTDAQPMTGASDRVLALKPVNFEWISSGERVDGFLAHEAQAVVPECVTGTKDAMRDEEYEVTAAVYEDIIIAAVLDEEGNELEAERTEQRLVTEAVMGTRSVPDYQGIDQSKLVPLLTAALQEALTEISALKVRVAALEAV